MKANKDLRQFAKAHNCRLVTIAFQTEKGSTAELEGCVLVEDVGEVAELFHRLVKLTSKPEDKHKGAKQC